MADGLDIDLYNLEDEFNQDVEFGCGDLYDDVITATSNSTSRRSRTWTTDQDLTDVIHGCGVGDLIEIKFNENRANGQSKGFALVVVGSEHSSRTIFDRLSRKELHGQILQVTHHTKQAFNQFEAQARKGGEQPPNGTFRERDRDRDRDVKPRGAALPKVSSSTVIGRPGTGTLNASHVLPTPFAIRLPQALHGVPPSLARPGVPSTILPPGPIPFAPPLGSLPSLTRPPPGSVHGLSQRPILRPHGTPRIELGPPRMLPLGQRGNVPLDSRAPPPRNEWDRLSASFPQSAHPASQPIPHLVVRQPAPVMRPFVPGAPPPGIPPVSATPIGAMPPAPHVNPAFFSPPPTNPGAALPVLGHPPPSADAYTRPPPTSHCDIYNRSIDSSISRRHEPLSPVISEQEFEEIFQRNKTVSSSAINRAVMDASSGDFASAIETLVTAISLIKQSKISSDDRCKILISSLQDTLHGIEEKSYGSGRSSSSRRSRSRDRDRDRGEKRSRSHRSRSRDRDYHERSRDRDRHYDDRHRDRERGEREREYAASGSGRSRH